MYSDDHESSSVGPLAFFIGGLVGAGVALLLAPETGRKTRERLRELSTGARERALDVADDMRDRMEKVVDGGRSFLEEKKAVVGAAYKAGRDAFQQERDRSLSPRPDSSASEAGVDHWEPRPA